MSRKNSALGIFILVVSMTGSPEILARGEGRFNNEGDHDLNNGYNNSFYYNEHLNDRNEIAIVPEDSDINSCQTSQICDSSGNCVTQQNCN